MREQGDVGVGGQEVDRDGDALVAGINNQAKVVFKIIRASEIASPCCSFLSSAQIRTLGMMNRALFYYRL